ncbi:hypothetical protein MHH70_12855 [Metasolibacillus sp. FSL H7-0170]|uniref:hypothetical protein n=1 Tax=Metasolibacillus TaxID=2703677 RepID=UPI000D3CAB2A|nr:hypothetical protein [Metasolibacillus fluoroglycofenilyticus]
MELNLIVIGFVFLLIGYLVGGTFAILGIGLLIFGFIGFKQAKTILMVAVGVILLEIVYVNAKMVE